MSKTTILIVEDEILVANELKGIVESLGYCVVGVFSKPAAVLKQLESDPVDLILLDISLGEALDGIDLAHVINTRFQLPFLYVTSHHEDEIIERVMHTHPIGFLNKPFTPQEVASQLKIALHKTTNSSIQLPQSLDTDEIFLKDKGSLIKLRFNEVLYVEAMDNYAIIRTADQKIVYSYPLKQISEKLISKSTDFLRVHRSYLVNVKHVLQVNHRELTLSNGAIIPISDSKKQALLDRLNFL